MKKLLAVLGILVVAGVSYAALPQPAAKLGTITLTSANLADTPETTVIDMYAGGGQISNTLSLTIDVTPGTSLVAVITCKTSDNGSTLFTQVPLCDSSIPSDCQPDSRSYTLVNWTAEGGGNFLLTSTWDVPKRYVQCTVDDPADGNGTVSMTGSRVWK